MATYKVIVLALIVAALLAILDRTVYAPVAGWITAGLMIVAVCGIVTRNIRNGEYRWKR